MDSKKVFENRKKPSARRPAIGFLNASIIEFFHFAWLGVADAAQEYNYNAINFCGQYVHDTRSFNAQANILYEMVDKNQLDGLIIHNINCNLLDDDAAQKFYDRFAPLPIVSLGRRPMKGVARIKSSAYSGMHKAIVHLIEVHGHQRIAFIKGLTNYRPHEERFSAYTDVLAEYNLPFDPGLVAVPRNSAELEHPDWGTIAVRRLIDEQKAEFDALVTNDDRFAENLLPELRARGIRVPWDLALVSFDDEKGSHCLNPPLTTVPIPIYEMGRQAALTLLAQIRGETVCDCEIDVPSDQLVIRQSCGCVGPKIADIKAGPVEQMETGYSFEKNIEVHRKIITAGIIHAAELTAPGSKTDWADTLLGDFVNDITSDSDNMKQTGFLTTLNKILHQVIENNGNIDVWQKAVFTMRRQLLPLLSKAEVVLRGRAEDLWMQSQILINDVAKWLQANRDLQAERKRSISGEIGTALATTFDVKKLMNILAEELPRLGISQGYVSLYENPQDYHYPQPPPEWSHLVLAFDQDNGSESLRIKIAPDQQRYPTKNLLPKSVIQSTRPCRLIAHALYFQNRPIGFCLLKGDHPEGNIYDTLQVQISNALQGALLIQSEKERTMQLSAANRKIRVLNEKLKDENLKISAEMAVAKDIQTNLLPVNIDTIHPEFEIWAKMITAVSVGGDYYDVMTDRHGNLWFAIGDVSGHGVTAGLIMMMAQTIHTTIIQNHDVSPKDIIQIINNVMIENVQKRMNANQFMTFNTMKYLGDGVFEHAGAHLDIIIFRKKTGTCEEIETNGVWLNVIRDVSDITKNARFTMDRDDILILHTDGIPEVFNKKEEQFGIERIKDAVVKHNNKPVKEIIDRIFTSVLKFSSQKIPDDMSLLIARKK